jgi:carboxymethylenebutenolidase
LQASLQTTDRGQDLQNTSSLAVGAPIEHDVVIATEDGPMRACVARPASEGPFAAAIVVQHIGGLSETMRIVARRIAQLGVLCVVPALYHRLGELVIDPVDAEPSVAAIRNIAVASLTPARLRMDLRATLDWLYAEPSVSPGARGLVSFGGGAGQAMRLAADFSSEIRALVCILGVGFIQPDNPDSPHLRIAELEGGAYFGFAGQDEVIPLSAVEALGGALAGAAVEHEIVIHPDVAHGYLFPNRPAYAPDAAEHDWMRVRNLFARHVAGAASL